MLASMRNAAQGDHRPPIMTIVMALIIVSFVIWGVGDMLRGFTARPVASVGGANITAQEFHYAYEERCSNISGGCAGRSPTNRRTRWASTGMSCSSLSPRRRSMSEARTLGLAISDEALRGLIPRPDFPGRVRRIRPQRFRQALRDFGLSERGFFAERARTSRGNSCRRADDRVAAPKSEARRKPITEAQTRSIDYFVLPAAAAGDIPAAVGGRAKAFFNDRKSSYRAPEYRAIDIVALDPKTLAKPAEVSDADAQGRLRKRRQGPAFSSPEKRDLNRSSFPNRGGGRRRRGQDQGRRELRRHPQGADLETAGGGPRRNDEGRHVRQDGSRRGVRPAARRASAG